MDFDYRDSTKGSHRRIDLRAQQYIPFFSKQRVIALRGYTAMTDARSGHRIPFYLQPTLGGPDTMRGFHPFRYHTGAIDVEKPGCVPTTT
ncbi:MAG: BamA/TamA family outer membrane protein [Bryobacteraceae bacterium]